MYEVHNIYSYSQLTLHTATAPAVRAAVKTVVSCRPVRCPVGLLSVFCEMHDALGSRFRLRFRMLQLKLQYFAVCKQKQEFIATDA